MPEGISRPPVRRAAAALTLLGGLLLVLSGTMFAARGASAESTRTIEMRIAYQGPGGWETAGIIAILEDNGGDFEAQAAAYRRATLERFPGGVEIDPEVSGQWETFDPPWTFPGGAATWFYNPSGRPEGLTGDAEAFQAAAATWTAAGAGFTFTYGGTTTAGLGVCNGNSRDGQNTVGWANLAPTVLAETCYSPTDAPDEFDLQFDNTKDWTTGDIDVQIDLQSVALHEFGHALGLAHTRDRDAVMVAQGVRGRLRRELTADDLAGLNHLYGAGAPTPTPTVPLPVDVERRGVVPALSRQ